MKITPTVETLERTYEGITFQIARAQSEAFQRKWFRLRKPFKKQLDEDRLPPDKVKELLCEALVDTVLLGWSGTFPDGEQHPYDPQLAKSLLVDDRDFLDWVVSIAGDQQAFYDDSRAYLEKKS